MVGFDLSGLIFTDATLEHFFKIHISQPLVGLDTSFLAVSDGEIEYYPLVLLRTLCGGPELSKICASTQTGRFSTTKSQYF